MNNIKLPEWLKDESNIILSLTEARAFLDDDEYRHHEMFYKLLADDKEGRRNKESLESMWSILKKAGDEHYFSSFFKDIRDSLERTEFSKHSNAELKKYGTDISDKAKDLANLLIKHDFDTTIYYALDEKTREYLTKRQGANFSPQDMQEDDKHFLRQHTRDINISSFLMQLSGMAIEKAKEKRPFVVSKTAMSAQNYFIKNLSLCMINRFNAPLDRVVGTAARFIFENDSIDSKYVKNYSKKLKSTININQKTV